MMHGALSDIKILDLTRVLSGPFATMWLGDLGAEVIKIETPVKGDDARFTPIHVNGNSTFFAAINRNKRSITLNLKAPEGKEMFLEMVKQADVVISNYRPGVMERLGLGYDVLSAVNEKIIYATISGFGQKGKYAMRPAYDIVAQGMGGIMSTTGVENGDPIRVGASISDITAGMNTVIGILAALHARTLTGRGQSIDVAMVDSTLALMPSENMRYFISGGLVPRTGHRYIGNAPYGVFKAKDRFFIIACGSDKLFYQFCDKVLNQPELKDDERFKIMTKRSDNYYLVKDIVEKWASQYTADEAVEIILAAGVPAGPIFDMNDISKDEHIVGEREMLVKMDQPGIGEITVTNNPVKLSDTKAAIRRPAPLLGQHNLEVYGELLGYDEQKLEELAAQGII
ncbi:MAG: CoA transferase [Oscillospiraceae bacterium]|nr:CoA transferase [Oscillospiraceae bacterium]